MQAYDRRLPDWFSLIRNRQLTLPRFQRFVAWGHGEVADLLTTVLRGLPAGASLILQVGDREKFSSRTMVDAPSSGNRVTEQLLDGQQRLTALWRCLHNKYPDRSYLINFADSNDTPPQKVPEVFGQARWHKKGTLYPIWVEDPAACWKRGYIPVHLLSPEEDGKVSKKWARAAEPNDLAKSDALEELIDDLRTKVREFNLPYLALAATTTKEVALDVFIKMNTSSVRLSTYDIVVALVEEETGASLHDYVDRVDQAVPRAKAYFDLPALVLDVVALLQDRVPSQAGYKGIDFGIMLAQWDQVLAGVQGLVELLEEEAIFDEQRLPSYPASPVIAALWPVLPTQPDKLGNALNVLRRFLWRAFLTSRYEQSTASNSLQDYRALKKVIEETGQMNQVPVFDEGRYPVPTEEIIGQQDWPKKRGIIARGLLALQMKAGAHDLADGKHASVHTIGSVATPREYHHLFPEALLKAAGLAESEIYRALNCALITWRTNRTISDKDPVAYLKERANNSTMGQEELERRLRTHFIPFAALAKGPYLVSDVDFKKKVTADYAAFCVKRAKLLEKAARLACDGRSAELSTLCQKN